LDISESPIIRCFAFKQGIMEGRDEIHDYVENAARLVQDGN